MLDVSYNAFGAATVIGVKPHMRDEFFAALDPRMRRMPKALVLSHLPPVTFERRDVEMEPKQKKAYDQMVDQMVAELDDDLLVTTSPLVRVTRLLQFASSYAEIEKEWNEDRQAFDEHVKLIEPSSKIKAFINDIDDFGDDSVVVFAVSKQLINMLSARLTKMGIEHGLITGDQNADQRQEAMDKFQAGKIRFMLCTIAAGGTGITLTKARIGVFLQRSWSMIDNIQAEARVHRIGSEQHNSVVIIDEQRRQAVLAHGVEHVVPLACQLDERGASVLTVSRAVHEPLADEAVDDPAGVGLVHAEVVGQGADASRAVGCDCQEDPVLRDGQGNRCGGHGPQGDAHQHTAEVEQRLRSA
jgi:superfamily II DNA or RNA helicase